MSIKGVCVRDDRVLLLYNERDEWELPGGSWSWARTLVECVRREISEETGWDVTVGPILDSWQYHIRDGAAWIAAAWPPGRAPARGHAQINSAR